MKKKQVIIWGTIAISVLFGICIIVGGETTTGKSVKHQETSQLPTGVNSSDWQLKVINVDHKVTAKFKPSLGDAGNGQQLDARALPSYQKMMAAAKADGAEMAGGSGYRSYEEQVIVNNRTVASHVSSGMTEEQAKAETSKAVNPAGSSEHQSGLAMDFVTLEQVKKGQDVEQSFGKTAPGKWLAKNSWKYGWVLRYPRHEKASTHIEYESWHYRYVGKQNAKYIYQHHLTLEQYVSQLKLANHA